MVLHKIDNSPKQRSYIEYTHSANTLFHFMSEFQYLQHAIDKCVIYPRYFKEWIRPLKISDKNDVGYDEMGVLGICFCDIPLNRIFVKEKIEYLDDTVPIDERKEGMSHPEIYGEYAIAFSKEWSAHQIIQPVRYYLQDAGIIDSYRAVIKGILDRPEDDSLSFFESFIMEDLALLKPVQGEMKRVIETDIHGKTPYTIRKNFFDEQEWRFVPSTNQCAMWSKKHRGSLTSVIANPNIIAYRDMYGKSFLDIQSDIISDINDKSIGLSYKYHDIKYLIVPNEEKREQLVLYIQKKHSSARNKETRTFLATLISKIFVLDDLRRDFS